jgi:hypothetical protein
MKVQLVDVKDQLEMRQLMGLVVSSMQSALTVMKDITKGQNADQVNKVMEEFQELSLESEEISAAIAMPNEDPELEEEFSQLEAEIRNEQLKFPTVPSAQPTRDNDNQQDEKELNALYD